MHILSLPPQSRQVRHCWRQRRQLQMEALNGPSRSNRHVTIIRRRHRPPLHRIRIITGAERLRLRTLTRRGHSCSLVRTPTYIRDRSIPTTISHGASASGSSANGRATAPRGGANGKSGAIMSGSPGPTASASNRNAAGASGGKTTIPTATGMLPIRALTRSRIRDTAGTGMAGTGVMEIGAASIISAWYDQAEKPLKVL